MAGRFRFRKGHKYRARPTVRNGIRFPSMAEANRYSDLHLLAMAQKITRLTMQPEFPLHVVQPDGTKKLIGKYRADFKYVDDEGNEVVEDVKGMKTPMYRWKKKHVEAEYGIKIVEVTMGA